MVTVLPIPALQDNYIWLITNGVKTIVVDPGEAAPVKHMLQENHWSLTAILLTHHHKDHCNGAATLAQYYNVPVYGPANELIPALTHPLAEGITISNDYSPVSFKVLTIPGHTKGHIAYYSEGKLFCGDTLFTGGCGRLYEGTAPQLFTSLQKLAQLPDETEIYCGHEYTLNNLRFASAVEPTNIDLISRYAMVQAQRLKNLPTVPCTLKIEKLTNPFLRCHTKTIQTAVSNWANCALSDAVTTFRYLRQWKDQYQ